MSTENERIERALDSADRPFDATAEGALEPDISPDRKLNFERTGFSRMRTSWIGDDAIMLGEVEAAADRIIQQHFRMAFNVIEKMWRCVRTPVVDSDGEIQKGNDGRILWETDEYGDPEEDWTHLGDRECKRFLFTITTHMFEWERARTKRWARAMYSKVQFEETFAKGFRTLPNTPVTGRPTVDDKTQAGYAHSMQERYFGVFQAAISKDADGILRALYSLQGLLQKTVTS